MNLSVEQRPTGHVPLGALLMAPLFFLPLGAWLVERGYIVFGTCGAKMLAGIPCLTCGSTRATIHLLHGDLLGALSFQPMMILIYALLLGWGLTSLIAFARGRRVRLRLDKWEDLALKIGVVAVPLLNWVYLWQAGV